MSNTKQIAEILHTIFCKLEHENDMMKYESTEKCCYYLEQSIEDTWSCEHHKFWIEQAEFFVSLSTVGLDALEQIVQIYRSANMLKKANPLYMKYVENILNMKGDKDDTSKT